MSILFLIHSELILLARRSHSNGDGIRHLGFINRFFAYWRSIREVYSVIDRLHVTGFIQSVFDILVRGEIKAYFMCRLYDWQPSFDNAKEDINSQNSRNYLQTMLKQIRYFSWTDTLPNCFVNLSQSYLINDRVFTDLLLSIDYWRYFTL